MSIYFAEVRDGVLHIKGGVHNRDGAEGFSKAIMWFLQIFPKYAVDRMLVPAADSTENITCIPLTQLRDWDYRLPVRAVLVTVRNFISIKDN